jgi:signal transduction histidine kinase
MNPLPLWERPMSKSTAFTAATTTIVVLGVIDVVTGYQVSMFIFYGVPIAAVAWFVDKKSAILMAIIAGLTWWWADQLSNHAYSSVALQVWETSVRYFFFLVSAITGALIKANYESSKARIRLLELSQKLEQEIVSISEEQQRCIGRDLHDGICQSLVALSYSASSLQKDLLTAGRVAEAAFVSDLANRLNEAAAQTRDLARGLIPAQIDNLGLVLALEELVASANHLLDVNCVFRGPRESEIFDHTVANHLYRIAQESINNSVRHGKAQRISVELKTDDQMAHLQVTDDGLGFDAARPNVQGLGLKTMHYRTRCMRGELDIHTAPGNGTAISCRIPRQPEGAIP